MDQPIETPVLNVSRRVHARRATVFTAFTTAEHVQVWFAPLPWVAAEARVEARVGGVFEVLMRGPDGTEHWARGNITRLVPDRHLTIDMLATTGDGTPLFQALTEIDLTDEFGGTRIDVRQTYIVLDHDRAGASIGGAEAGWTAALAQLEGEVLRMAVASQSATQPTTHGMFTIERRLAASPARVWRALTEPEAKAAWFSGPADQWQLVERTMDVREGGHERLASRWPSGLITRFDAYYHDVVPLQRLVYSYTMHLDAQKISVSLATVELRVDDTGTWLRMTEQGAFLDGFDDAGSREQGSGVLLDRLVAALDGG